MNFLQAGALLATICSASAFINQKTLKWPMVLAMTMMSIVLALVIIVAGELGWLPLDQVRQLVSSFDLADLVLHNLLAFLLFAGAMFVDASLLKQWAKPIASLASVGVFLSAVVAGFLIWLVAPLIGFNLSISWCLLFGSLIAATDPIAALAIVKKAGAPKEMEIKLVGESLFNDATSVMMFLIMLGIVTTGEVSPSLLVQEIFVAPVGGAALGIGLGWLTTKAITQVNHHPTEIMMTLALASGVYGLAEAIHVSAPIAVVFAGLIIGHKARRDAMSEETREHVDAFWEGLDEILNAVLFGLIGLELILIDVSPLVILLGVVAWVAVLLGRWVGVFGSLIPLHRAGGLGKGTTRVMVWGGLRGGISLALAMSLPQGPEANVLVAVTFIVVALSAAVQGLTLGRVIPKQAQADALDPNTQPETEGSSPSGRVD